MVEIGGVAVITSDRSVSLQRVAHDIVACFEKHGVRDVKTVYAANADPRLYADVSFAVTVMTYDPAWVLPYLFLTRELQVKGKVSLFYATIEGRVRKLPSDEWIYRDVTFVANSSYTRRKLESLGARVTAVVPHGVNVEAVKAAKWKAERIREKVGLPRDRFVVGYVAGCYARKGHDYFAEAIERVAKKDRKILFLVLTTEKCVEHYAALDNVFVLTDFGKLDQSTVYALYHLMDLYAQPSLSEGFGLPLLEAMAAGKPVVHADYEPLSEITTEDTSFRVRVVDVEFKRELGAIEYELRVYDPTEFADAILQAKDEVLRRRDELARLCEKRAKRFHYLKTYKYFANVYTYGGA